MGCNCGGKKSGAAAPRLSWSVDLTGTDKTFGDGTIKKTYSTIAEANTALAGLSLVGTVRPKPAAA